MRTFPLRLLLALGVSFVPGAAQTKTNDPVALVRAVTGSLVRVEYELQYDKADAPTGALSRERCPSCGEFHGKDLRAFLEAERPVETAGYLVAADRVVTRDPQIHPRFIKSITVRFGPTAAAATLHSYGREHQAVLLALDQALPGAQPLEFAPRGAGEFSLVNYQRENAQWTATVHPFPRQVSVPDSGAPHWLAPLPGVAVKADGRPVGVVLNTRLALDHSWQGPPQQWPWWPAPDVFQLTNQLQTAARAALVRVGLSFRSPKTTVEHSQGRSRYNSGPEEDEAGSGTERSVLGVVWDAQRVVVLAALKPRQTARLDRVTVFLADGSARAGQFVASLKNFGAFLVKLDEPVPGPIKLARTELRHWLEQLLLRADVTVQGESRTDYYQPDRLGALQLGWKGRVYPELEGEEADSAFLFSPQLELIALPLVRREPVSGGRDRYPRSEPQLTPASYLAEAVRGLPATGDVNNVPVAEAEENRLAWLGVELQPLNRDLARANGVADQTRDGETGALVTYVHPKSPAAEAGIEVGAVLLRLQVPGQPVPVEVSLEEDYRRAQPFPWDRLDEVQEQYFDRIPTPWAPVENGFTRALTDLGFGTRFTAQFVVAGRVVTSEFDVVAGPEHYESTARFKAEAVGVTVRDLTYEVRRYLQRKADEPGVVISKLEPGSKASVAGLKPYELITHINDQPVTSGQEFERLVAAGGELKLSLRRMAKGRIVSITVGAK
jgi:hypothetical protein